MGPFRKVVDLLDVHVVIERALLGARMAAMAGDEAGHQAWMARLDAVLRRHIAHEERWLLPLWAQADAPPNGTAAILSHEHDRLLDLLTEAFTDGAPWERAERLARLGAVLEHHDAREARGFKPGMDALLDAVERESILERITREMLDLPPEPDLPGPTLSRPALPEDDGTVRGALLRARAALATDRPADLERVEARLPETGERVAHNLRKALRRAREAQQADEADPVARRLARAEAFDRLRLMDPLLDLAERTPPGSE